MSHRSSVRIFCIIARNAPVAAVFRRGPSGVVHLLKWNLTYDTFEGGQWFKGRLYEHRCDLSPSGEFLLYFAAKHTGPFGTWTAVSRLPYLTALALWPKGDTWGGGGLFEEERLIRLNHEATRMATAPDFPVPDRVTVTPLGDRAGGGEDAPLYALRLRRDGWVQESSGKLVRSGYDPEMVSRYDPPVRWVKGGGMGATSLAMELHGVGRPQGPRLLQRFTVCDTGREIDLGECDWGDILENGDVLFAREGAIYRMPRRLKSAEPVQLVDLRFDTFTETEAPDWARRW
ncbi:MAG: hypothetical protein MI724_11150 [Spirochaetales bacterium]|nr:hypothetical protein [Spirochaetales bacterium]